MILIVDDNADLAEICAMLLRLYGYRAEVATGSKHAMDFLTGSRPRLLLSDCRMPGFPDLQLCDYLHRVAPKLPYPILLMSGLPQHLAASGHGYASFLKKPFLAETLLREVRQLIGAPRALAVGAPATIQ
ncbi:MAG: response regulator [Pseudomonadota bacterium]